MSKWLSIGEIVESVSITHKFDKPKLKFLNTADAEKGKIVNYTELPISELKGQAKKTIQKDDILFSEVRPKNKHYAYVDIEDCSDYIVSTKLMVLRKFNDDVDNKYFYYSLINDKMLDILQSRAENRICSFPQITFDLLSEYKIRIPEISEQKNIAHILEIIDEKIELNNKINLKLKNFSKTLYDYWFVQFDFPDEFGRPYKSSGGTMVYNEKLKQNIPVNWDVTTLDNIIDLFDSQRIPLSNNERLNMQGTYPYFGATGIMDYIDKYIFEGDYILLAEDGSISNSNGNPIVQYIWGKTWVNNHAHIIKPKITNHINYLYFVLKNIPVIKIETGSIQKKITQDNLLSHNVLKPQKELVDLFCNKIMPIRSRLIKIYEENQKLSQIRDFLLPMLMNGQIGITAE